MVYSILNIFWIYLLQRLIIYKKIINSVINSNKWSLSTYKFYFNFYRYYAEHYGNDSDGTNAAGEIAVAHTSIGAATSWAQLDNAVRRAFKQHVARLDPGGGLGLGTLI